MKAQIGIIGLGAIGSAMAKSLLVGGNNELYYFTRTPKTEIKIYEAGKLFHQSIQCSDVKLFYEDLDWVFVCLKAHQYESASHLFEALIGNHTKVAVIRNGINLTVDLLPFVSIDAIVPCVIDCPVQPGEGGGYKQFRKPKLTIPESSLSTDFEHLFTPSNIEIYKTEDYKTASWKKLIESASMGVLQCIHRDTCRIFRNPKILSKYGDLINEGIEVALADGAKIEEGYQAHLLQKVTEYPIDKGSSMLTDLMAGKRLEMDAKTGAILEAAHLYGIDVPLTESYCYVLEDVHL